MLACLTSYFIIHYPYCKMNGHRIIALESYIQEYVLDTIECNFLIVAERKQLFKKGEGQVIILLSSKFNLFLKLSPCTIAVLFWVGGFHIFILRDYLVA